MFWVAIIGAIGQAIILCHDLVDTYPYKAMTYPWQLYEKVGTIGFIVATLFSVLLARYLSNKTATWTAAIVTLVCPLVFLFLFVSFQVVTGVDWHSTHNFDRTTPLEVLKEFMQAVLWLMILGFGIGLLCGGTIKALFKVLNRSRVAI